MPLRINTNTPAFNTQRILNITGRDLKTRIERLSSGLKVNRAAYDAAGLSVSEGLRAEIIGFSQGMRNAEQATNLIQTAEGALGEIALVDYGTNRTGADFIDDGNDGNICEYEISKTVL